VRDLSGVGGVVHEEEINVGDVVDEEGLVAGRHEMASFPVGAVSNLDSQSIPSQRQFSISAYLWHGSLALESSSDAIVDTLWLSP
jgi:hypothetical protein